MTLAVVLALSAATNSSNVDVKAEEILRRARAYVASRTYPEELAYTITVSYVNDRGGGSARTYDSAYDASTGDIYTRSISEEENAQPYVPRGINVVVGLSASTSTGSTGTSVQINRPGSEPDIIGVPMITPTYTFGLGQQLVAAAHAERAPYRVIAVSGATNRNYDARYVGDETVDGEACAHLRLTPARDPGRFRLRDVWVAADGAPLQLTTHGNFTSKPWDGVDWKMTYRRDGSALYLEREMTEEAVRIDRFRQGRVTLTFGAIVTSGRHDQFLLKIEPNNPFREPDASRS